MKEAFENLHNAEVEPREKLKVTKADIVVALPLGEPYFNIHYREVGKGYDNVGFGSYDLNNVFKWREEEMEIVSEVEEEYGNGKTNADRIRLMSDKELAEFLCGVFDEDECDGKYICGITIPNYDEEKITEWLKSTTTD